MRIRLKSSISYLFNCVVFDLISGQINEPNVQTSGLNFISNQTLTKSNNSSLPLDILDYNQITLDTFANSSVNICDNIDCINNIAICEQNRCSPIKQSRKAHYIVTCAILLIVIGLMLTTVYAYHKESKRLKRWNNSCNRAEDHMIAIRLVNSFNYNRHFTGIQTIREMTPLTFHVHSEPPPPYEDNGQYTPPPVYQETVEPSNVLK